MLSKVTSIMHIYDEKDEPKFQAIVTSYYLFGLLAYRKVTDKDAIIHYGVKA